jgi:hypothetical protein
MTEETLRDFEDGKYRVGEVWNYATRPGDEGSTFTVLKVESSSQLGVIVQISVDGFRVANPHAPNDVYEKIGHMPVRIGRDRQKCHHPRRRRGAPANTQGAQRGLVAIT